VDRVVDDHAGASREHTAPIFDRCRLARRRRAIGPAL
jgi:hypothetical protein